MTMKRGRRRKKEGPNSRGTTHRSTLPNVTAALQEHLIEHHQGARRAKALDERKVTGTGRRESAQTRSTFRNRRGARAHATLAKSDAQSWARSAASPWPSQ